MKTRMILLIGFLFSSLLLSGQQKVEINSDEFALTNKEGFKEAWNSVKNADKLYKQDTDYTYRKAISNYLDAYKYNSGNAELNYKIGVSYLRSNPKSESLPFLKKAYELNPQVAPDILKQLGRALQINYEFEKAMEIYEKYLARETDEMKYQEVEKFVRECKSGIEFSKNPNKVFIDNLGKYVNSHEDDYSPIITADQSRMYFTSRREGTTGYRADQSDYKYLEDIYFSFKIDKLWGMAVNVGDPINTAGHDAIIGLAHDASKIFIYRDKGEGDIYQANYEDKYWETPKKLPKQINSKYHESSISLTYDGKTMYFTSEKPQGSQGGSDIFYCQLDEEGEWSEPVNAGPEINTPYREETVFVLPDGKTMYFSSEGHNSIGGLDIFVSKRNSDGSWSKPINLGVPINTPEDDFSITVTHDQKFGYYSSLRKDSYGGSDIYKITFLDPKLDLISNEDNLILSSNKTTKESFITKLPVEYPKDSRVVIFKGKTIDKTNNKPIKSNITLIDVDKNEIIDKINSKDKSGEFILTLPSGKNYGISFDANNYLLTSVNYNIPSAQTYQELNQDIALSPLEKNAKTVLQNIFFEDKRDIINHRSLPELNNLINFLMQKSNLYIEIACHTIKVNNKNLSEARAKSVASFLSKKGIKPERIIARGYGASVPAGYKNSFDSNHVNERIEIKILKQ